MSTLTEKTLDQFLAELRHLNIKLWAEGERLRYKAAKETITPELLSELRNRKTEILEFLQQANLATNSALTAISPVSREIDLPLSFSQERLWFQHQLEPNSPINNMPAAYRLRGSLNLETLHRVQDQIIERHEILRTTFPAVNRQPTLSIASSLVLPIPIQDLQAILLEQREAAAQELAIEESRRPFDLENGPLLRLHLLRLSPKEHLLILTLHRIVADGWSVDILFREILALYEADVLGKPVPLATPPIQYADYAYWQRQKLQGEFLENQLRYWKQQLAGNLPRLNLPTDRPRPPIQTFNGSRRRLMFSKTLNDALNALSQEEGATLFMTLLAAFKVLLYRYASQEDVIVCFPHAGRQQGEIENLIGSFFNTLVLRTNLAGEPSFRDLIRRVKDIALGAFAHSELPFDQLLPHLTSNGSQGRSSLFQVMFALNPPWTAGNTLASVELPELTVDSLFGYLYTGQTKFDLTLIMRETDEGLRVLFEYNTDLFDGETILRMIDYFRTLLDSIVANPDQQISKLQLLTPQEQQQLIVDWNPTETDQTSCTRCIQQLIEAQVEKTPDAIALIAQNRQITYRELNQQANQVAHYLNRQGVSASSLIAICTEPSVKTVVVILGILKAGGAYLPLNPIYPHERIANQIKQSQPELVLTESHLRDTLLPTDARVICLDHIWQEVAQEHSENPVCLTSPAHLSCVLYTSDVDGLKGIRITHGSLSTRSLTFTRVYEIAKLDRVLQYAHTSSAVLVEELFSSLISGATAVLCPEAVHASPAQFWQFVEQQQLTVVNLSTAFWHELVNHLALQPSLPESLRLTIVGGETVSCSAYQRWRQVAPAIRWLHAYGLTETTATATIFDPQTVSTGIDTMLNMPIGRPLPDTQIYILDRELQPVPIGVPGELYIGGAGIAQGYLNQPSEPKFIPHPFSSNAAACLCRTGDLARYRSDGNIEFLDRLDNQIKYCGFRVDLAEIEAALISHPAVQQGAVLRESTGDQQLLAYIVMQSDQELQAQEIRDFLKQKLPYYMIPAQFLPLPVPLTSDGKIDRRALELNSIELQAAHQVVFRDDLEQRLTEIWQQVLGIQSIGVTDNFFDLGGHSILAVQLFAQIEAVFQKNLPLATLLQAPTIEQLANGLRQEEVSWSPLVQIQAGHSDRPPLFCIHGGGFNVLVYRDLAINLGADQPVYGLQAQGLYGRGGVKSNRLEEIAADYIKEIRSVQPTGPYYLSGLSNGGNIALEMAQQLQAEGEQVALLAMFDTYGPDGISLLPPLPRLLSSIGYVIRYSLPRFGTKIAEKGVVSALQSLRQPPTPQQTSAFSEAKSSPTPGPGSLEDWMNRISQSILEHSPWSFFKPAAQLEQIEGSLSSRLKTLEAEYSKIHKTYELRSYRGKITLFLAQECPPGYKRAPALGWKQIATRVEVYSIPGHHVSIMQSQVLANCLKNCIASTL